MKETIEKLNKKGQKMKNEIGGKRKKLRNKGGKLKKK